MIFEDLCSVSSSPSLDSLPGALHKVGSTLDTSREDLPNTSAQHRILGNDYSSSSSSNSSSGLSVLFDVSDSQSDVLRALPRGVQRKENQQPLLAFQSSQAGAALVPLEKNSFQDAAEREHLVARWATHDSAQAVLDVAYATERALQELELEMQLQGPRIPMVR